MEIGEISIYKKITRNIKKTQIYKQRYKDNRH